MKLRKLFMFFFCILLCHMTAAPYVSAEENADAAEMMSGSIESVNAYEASPMLPEDGVYTADSFSWSGGSGRLSISCDSIIIEDGRASAIIIFTSGKISYVKVDHSLYSPIAQTQSTSTYEIPVQLNTNTVIAACTTAMSQPHEIEYELYIGLGNSLSDAAEDPSGIHTAGDPDITSLSDNTEHTTENADRISSEKSQDDAVSDPDDTASVEIPGITRLGKTTFDYAECVDIYQYEEGYKLIDVHDDCQYLVVPEGKEVPADLDPAVKVLQQPLDHIYVAATASMALFNAIDGLDNIAYSSLKSTEWYVEAAADAMESGAISYAGKYSRPDYELLLSGGCDLAVESTMILHAPDVQEMIENLGIPVFIDRASYESHPLGRTEWVKVYGAMLNKEDEADAFFDQQKKVLADVADAGNTGKTVAFFSVNSNGIVVIRNKDDYVPKMIEMAGGIYVPADSSVFADTNNSSLNITMEEFYKETADADYLIYNSTIEAPLNSLNDLFDKSELFQTFKAVQEGHVWCTDKYLYQATDIVGQLILDFNEMLTDGGPDNMTFLKKIE